MGPAAANIAASAPARKQREVRMVPARAKRSPTDAPKTTQGRHAGSVRPRHIVVVQHLRALLQLTAHGAPAARSADRLGWLPNLHGEPPMAFALKTAVAIVAIHCTAIALADPTPAPVAKPFPASPAPVAQATPTAADATPAAKGDEPSIAPPAPDASPKKVEEAKEVAKTAELTPLVPNPKDATRPAFQLYAEIDIPILAVGTVFAAARRTKTQPAFCAPQCDAVSLNALDKLTAGYYSAGWSRASDVGLYGLGAAAAVLLLTDEGFLNALNDGVVIGEATLSATAVASIMTLAAGRPRPFLYGDPNSPDGYKAPLSIRNSGNAALSFLSSHTDRK